MITLFGHGYIGTAIARVLEQAGERHQWLHHGQAQFRDTIIINAAGFTGSPNVDACEAQRWSCIEGNVLWPEDLERIAGDRPVIHVSSGCIYNGFGPWSEEDAPNFQGSFYSLCKWMGEDRLRQYLIKSYVMRLRMPFGRERQDKNLLVKLAHYPKLIDVRNSLTCIEDAVKAIMYFARTLPPPGIYNVTNPGSVTTREIADWMGLKKQWFVDEAEFLKTVKAPRSNCTLDTSKLEALYSMRKVSDALKDCIGHWRQGQEA